MCETKSAGLVRRRGLACFALIVCTSAAPSTVFAVCGDGVLEAPAEQCDDGNADDGDCCAADCQYEPISMPCGLDDLCTKAGNASCDGQGQCSLGYSVFCGGSSQADLLDRVSPDEQRLKLRGKGSQSANHVGDPSAGTQYALCVYNFHFDRPFSVDYRLLLPVGAGWQPTSDGFEYRRPHGAATPVVRARVSDKLRAGSSGNPYHVHRARLLAGGSGLELPGPVDASRYFDADGAVSSICLVNDLGFMVGVSTFGLGNRGGFLNDPEHVHWSLPRLGD